MANFGLQEFSAQEAVNFQAYTDWNWELLDLSSTDTDDTSTYITANNPAKKIVLYVEPTVTGILLTSFAIQSVTGQVAESIALISFH